MKSYILLRVNYAYIIVCVMHTPAVNLQKLVKRCLQSTRLKLNVQITTKIPYAKQLVFGSC